MLDYARQHAIEALKLPHRVVLVTSGPAGVQAGEFACEAIGLNLYLLVPRTSDHLFNLEHESSVTLLAAGWDLKGEARIICDDPAHLQLDLLGEPGAEWCELVRIIPYQIQIRREQGWGYLETIDLTCNLTSKIRRCLAHPANEPLDLIELLCYYWIILLKSIFFGWICE